MTAKITRAMAGDESRITDTIVRAFSTDPAARWMYPDLQEYFSFFPQFVGAFGGRAFACGTAYRTEDGAGAALWLAPGWHPDYEAVVSLIQQTVPAPQQEALFAVFEKMGAYHPDEPHWHLPMMGVDPAEQGKGYGSALLQHALRVCNEEGTPAYLESSNVTNIPLYERHGFEVLGTIQVGSSPPITPMLRPSH